MTRYLDYAGRGANAWWRYLAAIGLALVLVIVLTAAIVIPLQLAGLWPSDFAQRLQDMSRPLSFYLVNGVIFLLVVVAFALAIRIVHRKRFADIIGAWSWRTFGAGAAIWTGALIVTVAVDVVAAPSGFRYSATSQTPLLVVAALAGLAIQTFAEEFVFRGYLTQGLLLATRRPFPAAIISGLLFGALHIPNGAPQAANAALFGVVLALIAIRLGGLAFTFGLHLANNLFGAVVVVSSGDAFRGSPGLFTQTTPHLMWWDAATGSLALVALAVVVLRRPAQADALSALE